MKNFLDYFIRYFKEEIKWNYFITVFLFIGFCVFFQYNFKLTNFYVEHYRRDIIYYPRAFILYAIPFAGTLLLYSFFYKKWMIWRNPSFVFLIIVTLTIYALRCGITFHTDLISNHVDPLYKSYWLKVSNQLMHGSILLIFPFICWLVVEHKTTPLYGFKIQGVNLKPYLIILLCLMPLIVIAATQKDFLSAYPRFANTFKAGTENVVRYCSLFELSYAFDLSMNEFFFRGFIILAFARFIGKGIILPMALFYCFIHFGKPLGETISSFIGGLALGIITYETRSIYGGIILHIGIAWLMEIGAGLGRFFLSYGI